MNFEKFLRAALFIEYLLRLLLNVDFVKCAFYSTTRQKIKRASFVKNDFQILVN